jgi:hypothetical protein
MLAEMPEQRWLPERVGGKGETNDFYDSYRKKERDRRRRVSLVAERAQSERRGWEKVARGGGGGQNRGRERVVNRRKVLIWPLSHVAAHLDWHTYTMFIVTSALRHIHPPWTWSHLVFNLTLKTGIPLCVQRIDPRIDLRASSLLPSLLWVSRFQRV